LNLYKELIIIKGAQNIETVITDALDINVLFVRSDISRGQEQNPIQCVNVEDDEGEPTDFVYVSENCFTSNIFVDRTITLLQSCKCLDVCSSADCQCGKISLRCWYDDQGQLLPDFNYAGE
jgi:euchromatic histone-lysine N-methyltransferase